jgi:hypothetical protein
MAPQRKRKNQEPAADSGHGDAYEPLPGEIVNDDFPPAAPADLQSMVERVADSTRMPPEQGDGKKEWVKSLTCVTDPDTGMRFHFDYEHHLGVITFEKPPSKDVTQKVQDGGYRYKQEVKAWLFPLTSGHWEADRKHAKKVFWQVNGAVRAEMCLPPFVQTQDQGPIPD